MGLVRGIETAMQSSSSQRQFSWVSGQIPAHAEDKVGKKEQLWVLNAQFWHRLSYSPGITNSSKYPPEVSGRTGQGLFDWIGSTVDLLM